MSPPADWYPDPTRRHSLRYWDGSSWTQHVAAPDGTTATDGLTAPDDEQEPASPKDQAEWLHAMMGRAMVEYGELLQEASDGAMDDATFMRRAFQTGLIVRDSDAWLLDLSSGRWFRYDGIALSQLEAPNAAPGPDAQQEGA